MRHERAILILLAYVIGFTTAYIGFGLNASNSGVEMYERVTVANVTTEKPQAESPESSSLGIKQMSDGLYAVTKNYDRVLSAQLISAASPREGFHYKILAADVSPSGDYIYYCAQQVAADAYCYVYIYELASDSVYRVTHDGEQITLGVDNVLIAWQSDSRLRVVDHVSPDPTKPWLMH